MTDLFAPLSPRQSHLPFFDLFALLSCLTLFVDCSRSAGERIIALVVIKGFLVG